MAKLAPDLSCAKASSARFCRCAICSEPAPSGKRFVEWWSREYFGDAAAPDAAEAYRLEHELIDRWDMQTYACDKVAGRDRTSTTYMEDR